MATAAARQPSGRRQEKENMAAFLAKKREIFLVQVSTCSMPCLLMHSLMTWVLQNTEACMMHCACKASVVLRNCY